VIFLREDRNEPMESIGGVNKGKRKESRYRKRRGVDFKLRSVKLRLEEGLPVSLFPKEVGASKDAVRRWVKAYQERGEVGLRNQMVLAGSRRKLPGPAREKIVKIKKRVPFFGSRFKEI
jgi:transposase-like protein